MILNMLFLLLSTFHPRIPLLLHTHKTIFSIPHLRIHHVPTIVLVKYNQ